MSDTLNHQSLRIFTIISQLEQLLEIAPRPKLAGGATKRIVDISEVFDIIGDLKVTIPEDIRKANSVLLEATDLMQSANNEALEIIEKSRREAAAMLQQAQEELEHSRALAEHEFEARVSEDALMAEVQRRSDLLQQHAEHNANAVYESAKQYADATLQHLQSYLMENYHRIGKNREDLNAATAMPPLTVQQKPNPNEPPSQERQVKQREPIMPPQVEDATIVGDYGDDDWAMKPRRSLFRRNKVEEITEEDIILENNYPDVGGLQGDNKRGPRRFNQQYADRELDVDLDE